MSAVYIRDVPIGSRVRVCGFPSGADQAWLVQSDREPHRLLAWKDGEICHVGGWKRDNEVPRSVPTDFIRFWWVDGSMLVEVISTTTTVGGMFCKGCTNWFDYVVPNRPSGNFVCWSCRQGFIRDEW